MSALKPCPECDGVGSGTDIVAGHYPNFADERSWSCPECDGAGEVELGDDDFDGELVRVADTGFIGVAYRCGETWFVADAADEVEVGSIAELELLEPVREAA